MNQNNIDEVQSSGNLNSQHILSRSHSRLQSSIQKINSHIQSTLPHLQGKADKKYIYMKIHNFFEDSKIESFRELKDLLRDQFQDKIQMKFFKDRKELLKDNYNDNELHYIIVPKVDLDWASTFAKQEREENNNKVKIYVYGILKKQDYDEKIKARSKKRLDTVPDYIEYFYIDEPDYPQRIVNTIQTHLDFRLREEGNHVKTWALTNKYAGRKIKKRTLHFFYEERMQAEFTGIYKTFKKKSHSTWLQIYAYRNFEDVLKKIREREVAQTKEVETARRATSKIMMSQSNIDAVSLRSGLDGGMGSGMNSSVLSASIRAINKLDQNDLNIIICQGHHSEIQKFRALVRAQKFNNWFLWEIEQGSSDVMTRLRDFLNEQAKNNQILQTQEYDRILHSKHLIIMAHVNDDTTIGIFQNQRNTLNHMELIIYNDPDEFSLFLREGVKSLQNFTIAVVPGGFRSYAAEYGRVITEFNNTYRNGETVQNFKFVSSAVGRHGSNIFVSSNLLGTQSNLTDVRGRYDEDLEKIMKERDKQFHPFEGLTGVNVYLLIQESIQDELDGIMPYVADNIRIMRRTYMDKQWLKLSLKTLTIKDSVIVITNDNTLREAQQVLDSFEKVYILNITNRENPKVEKKVFASGPKSLIYDLIRSIPTEMSGINEDQVYNEVGKEITYTRVHRMLPKHIDFSNDNMITVRFPASLKDEESHKMEMRLRKHFAEHIKIEYYKQPKEIRILNKSEEALSFIVWAHNSLDPPAARAQQLSDLQYLKEMAQHENEQLRQQYVMYSDTPDMFRGLVQDSTHTRFKFISNKWERIEEYIIGFLRQPEQDWIFCDEMMIVFHDDNDPASKEMIEYVKGAKNENKLNGANYIQLRIMEDIKRTLEEESMLFKYYIVYNERTSNLSRQQLQKFISDYRDYYVRLIVVRGDDVRKTEKANGAVKRSVANYDEAGRWLCKTEVRVPSYYYITPHVVIDKDTQNYYYFLDKFSGLTQKFTYSFAGDKEEVKRIVNEERDKGKGRHQVWIVVSELKNLVQYARYLQKCQNYKNGNVRFIYEGSENVPANLRSRVIFRHEQKREVQKFLLNIYRRDKHIFFPSSVGSIGSVVLLILNHSSGAPLAINEQEILKWQNILKAKVLRPKNMAQLTEMAQSFKKETVYIIVPYAERQKVANTFDMQPNVKRILFAYPQEYDFRNLNEDKLESSNQQIFRGTYPGQITEYLRFLRYNIRKPEMMLERSIHNQLIELYFQKGYQLSPAEVKSLTAKNDSIIINRNGYDPMYLPEILKGTSNFNYLHVFVGDEASGKQIMEFNNKNNRDVRFIDMKTSEVSIARGESKNKNWLLETNDGKELIAYLFNLPENRYNRALGHKDKFNVYVNASKANTQGYLQELKRIQKRNNNINIYYINNYGDDLKSVKDPAYVVIHSENERLALESAGKNAINYWIVNEDYKNDKSYASTGNKYFIAKKPAEFQNFMNQIPIQGGDEMVPQSLPLSDATNLLNSITSFRSQPLPIACVSLGFNPPLKTLPTQEVERVPVQLEGVLDSKPPSLSTTAFPKADVPPQPIGLQFLKIIKDSIRELVDPNVLRSGLDFPPTREFKEIKNYPDNFSMIPLPLKPLDQRQPVIRQKLAVLHPSNPEFTQIGEMLKRNLEPDQFSVNVIPFRSEVDLQEYSKNNGQKLNGYDKIVVFLSNAYRKYDPILKAMKGKLGGRMEYFIFDDLFHLENHQKLKAHLRPYRIKKCALPYAAQTPPRFLNHCAKILILVPNALLRKYEPLKSGNVNVIPYGSDQQTHMYLHSENTFIILVTTKEDYHHYKLHAKISPSCILLVDTQRDLPQDELFLDRIWIYSIFYGQNGNDYLRQILPGKAVAPFHDKNKYLFYSLGQEEFVFGGEYDDYEKIYYKDWAELYNYLVMVFKGKNNWLIKNTIGRPELVPLHPLVYMENKPYMKDFKNNYGEVGYLNTQNITTKSKLIQHEFSDLPQAYYVDDKDLFKHLQKQEAPAVVLYNLSNLGKISFLRAKFNRHKWIGITDNEERWIDPEGILMDVHDERLKRKQDLFANMFNKEVFDAFNDMRYFYLSNKANLDKTRNIYFRTKEQLLQIFHEEPNLLMMVFAQAKDVNHVPQIIMAQSQDPNGRVKLILLKIDFVDDDNTLYIKFNEIDPVIKHINDVENAGRIDFMVYHQNEGERTVQTLIQKKKLRGLDDRVYTTMDEVEDIAYDIKGKYRKVYVVCFEDEKQEIENIFNKYSIKNKGVPGEGVQFNFIDRKSFIIPSSSRLQPYGSQIGGSNLSPRVMNTPNQNLLPTVTNSKIALTGADDVQINVTVRKKSEPIETHYSNENMTSHRQVITITHGEVDERGEDEENENDYSLPNVDSNIKPEKKIDSILSNKNYVLTIDDRLKTLFPVGKFFANKATFFTNPNNIPQTEHGVAQLIIAAQMTPQIVALSQDPDKLVVLVSKNPGNQKNVGNAIVMGEDQVPGLIRRLQGSSVEDELNSIRNIDDYAKVRVVYDRDIDFESKRRLLAASDKNKKIYPIVYKNVNQVKGFLQEPDSLLLLMMKEVPAGLQDAVEMQNKTIVKKKKVKMIVAKKSDSDVDGLETILEEEEAEQEGDNLKYLSDQQVDVYLKLFETSLEQRPRIIKPDDWEGDRYHDRFEGQGGDMDNITRLNVHSNIDPDNLLHENQIEKIKQRLNGDFIVLVVDNSKRGQVDEAIKKFNVLVQGYTNSMNLQNDIRDRKDNVTIAVIDRNMLDKIPLIKKKYPHTAFILEYDNSHDQGIEVYRQYLSGQIKKIADLDKIIADLYQENERIRFNVENNRAASRFEMKRTSVVDHSNNERFTVGLSNQKSKKAFLFYKDPDNNHIRNKMTENFANISCVPYKTVADFKRLIDTYNNYSSILIANGNDIPELQEFVSKKKQLVYVIRFNPAPELRDNPKVKKLLSTFNKDDLERFIMDEFQKYSFAFNYEDLESKYKSTKNVEGKRYIQKYEPNTFGTTPRFSRDFVPPKSKESTYSRRYQKSTSRSKLASRLQALSPKVQRNEEYYQS